MSPAPNMESIMVDIARNVVREELARQPVQERLLTVPQVGVYLGRTSQAVRHLIRSGKIERVRIDGRVMIDRRDLDNLIEEHKS